MMKSGLRFIKFSLFTEYYDLLQQSLNSNCIELLLFNCTAATWRHEQGHVTPPHPGGPLCNFSPSVAANGGEMETVSHLRQQTWRPQLQDQHKTSKSQQERWRSVASSVCDWRGSGKADITAFTSSETASGSWLVLLQGDSSLPTIFTTFFGEVLPFSHLLFAINTPPQKNIYIYILLLFN